MSVHILLPSSLGGDGDKCVCGVRLSHKQGRRSAMFLAELTCEKCYLRCLRSWQLIDPSFEADLEKWPGWPWEDARFVVAPPESESP